MSSFKRMNHHRFILYVVVGSLSSLINYALFSLFYGLLHWHYQIALTLGFFSGAIFNFISNRTMTFSASAQSHSAHKQLIKYLVLLISNYCANLGLTHMGVEFLFLSPYAAVLLSIVTTVLVTYLISKHWVFK